VTNNGFKYESHMPKVKYALEEYERAALKEVGQLVARATRMNIDAKLERFTGGLRKNVRYFIRRKTKSVEIGIRSSKDSFYAAFVELGHRYIPKGSYYNEKKGNVHTVQRIAGTNIRDWNKKTLISEFGGRNVPPHPYLVPAAENNIAQIRAIIAKHMKGMNGDGQPPKTDGDRVMA